MLVWGSEHGDAGYSGMTATPPCVLALKRLGTLTTCELGIFGNIKKKLIRALTKNRPNEAAGDRRGAARRGRALHAGVLPVPPRARARRREVSLALDDEISVHRRIGLGEAPLGRAPKLSRPSLSQQSYGVP